ncbi:MAG: DNA helicase PcrA [Clostridia bacterium]|nr:DNA helicase PcrA [Clostridia bacterium]
MDLNKILNDQQAKAVRKTEGPLLILAGAGSGKTRVLTYRIAYLIGEHGVNPSNIAAITFTNKAADEMKERVANIVGELGYFVTISTFHSFCVRILRRNADKIGYNNNFVIYDAKDQLTLVKECIKELDISEKYYAPKSVKNNISNIKDTLINYQEFAQQSKGDFRKEKLAEIYRLYQQKLQRNNAFDFDDLIMKTVELFETDPDVLKYYQNKFRYLMVDEYQDTNTAQYKLVKFLSEKHRNICVVGDDDQSIYGWRGADVRNILDFEKDFPESETIKLEQNYRSTQTILDAANNLIKNNYSRKKKRLWTSNGRGQQIVLYEAVDEKDEAEYVCQSIKEKLDKQSLKYSDFAVLYRINAQSRVMEDALMKYKMPYRMVGGLRFYDRKEIKDLIAYLRVIVNPLDNVSFLRIINVPKRGIGAKTISRIQEYAASSDGSLFSAILDCEKIDGLTKRAISSIEQFKDIIIELMAIKETGTISELIEYIIEKTGYKEQLMAEKTEEAEVRLENIKEFISAAKEYEQGEEQGNIQDFLENIALVSDIDTVDAGGDGVLLMTMHSAKGLEFPVVFIIGMEEGIFPHVRSLFEEDELEEERRLCYVGITRAQQELFMTCARQRTIFGKTNYNTLSRFINEIPENLTNRGNGDNGNDENETILKEEQYQDSFQVGQKVIHKKFGNGTVVGLNGQGKDTEINIAFDGLGVKKLVAFYAPIKKI